MKLLLILCALGLVGGLNLSAFDPVIPLETERLYLRQFSLEDVPAVARIALDPQVLKLTGLFPPLATLEDVGKFIQNYLIGDNEHNIAPRYPKSWAIVEKKSDTVIGMVVFVACLERHQRAEIAYALAPAYWNQGYATEACQAVIRSMLDQGFLRLYATVDPENKASERVLQKLTMSCEGTLRSYMTVGGKRVDRKMYAIAVY